MPSLCSRDAVRQPDTDSGAYGQTEADELVSFHRFGGIPPVSSVKIDAAVLFDKGCRQVKVLDMGASSIQRQSLARLP